MKKNLPAKFTATAAMICALPAPALAVFHEPNLQEAEYAAHTGEDHVFTDGSSLYDIADAEPTAGRSGYTAQGHDGRHKEAGSDYGCAYGSHVNISHIPVCLHRAYAGFAYSDIPRKPSLRLRTARSPDTFS